MSDTPTPRPVARYPIRPKPERDARFTIGLTVEVGELLVRHGYDRPEGTDWADLQQALYEFLYVGRDRS